MTTSFIVSLIVLVLTLVGLIQIITKAGYSPWWILLPLSVPVLWVITWAVLLNDFNTSVVSGAFGGFSLFGFAANGNLRTLTDLTELSIIVNFVMFLVLAFSDWPVIRAARGRIPVIPPGGGFGGVAPRAPAGGGGPGAAAPSPVRQPPAPEGQPPGWFASGAVGAGEQSYWDGSAWIARRKWQNNAWVDLPIEPVVAEAQPENSA